MARANPNLLSQLVIYDYSKTLNAVAAQGFRFGRMHERNRRGVMFSKKRVASFLPLQMFSYFFGLAIISKAVLTSSSNSSVESSTISMMLLT